MVADSTLYYYSIYLHIGPYNIYIYIYIYIYILYIGESNRIRTVPEYGHYRYLRNHKPYKKMFNQ